MSTNQFASMTGISLRLACNKLTKEVAEGRLQTGMFGKHRYYWPAAKG